MLTKIINGNLISQKIRKKIKDEILILKNKNKIPGLAVILIGNNKASEIYVKNKIKACEEIGIFSIVKKFELNVKEKEILSNIKKFNENKKIHGILIQLPIPKHINLYKIINNIDPSKDVDGFHEINMGALMIGKPKFKPCTPYGIMKIFKYINCKLKSLNVVIINSSNIVGKPLSMLLLQKKSTVTICNSKTLNLSQYTKKADIIISATGKKNIITSEIIKKNSIIIDVGINYDKNNKICGDVDFLNVKKIVKYITPVPGGVGPMTITALLLNTLKASKKINLLK